MEVGDVDTVIKYPQHPYTRLLVDSIPWPDIDRRWGETQIKAREMDFVEQVVGCRFSSRCPFVMDKCSQDPPLFQLNDFQAASCFLQEGHQVIAPENISDLLPV
jgi:peptide/nickel transport system ATP-binding protein